MTKIPANAKFVISSLKKGDQRVFERLYSDYFEKLCRFLLNYTQNKELTEDIVQDTFVKLWMNREKLTISSSLNSYLYKSVYNNFIDNYRKKKKRDALLESYYQMALDKIIDTDEEYKEERLKKLDKCIAELPPKCKEVFISIKFSGMKYKEVATKLNISLKTVEGHTRKAYSLIKNCMG
ncbi:MAG TPA: RNA polymerase sigma-70 factor [Lutibacter sp.]